MKKLRIVGTSFLMPNNKAWQSLQLSYSVNFSDYGDWGGTLLKAEADDLVMIIICMEDVVSERGMSLDEIKKRLRPFISMLRLRCETSTSPTLLGLCKGFNQPAISGAKRICERTKAFNWFSYELEAIAIEHPLFYHVSLDEQFSWVGMNGIFDLRNWYLAHCRFSATGIAEISKVAASIFDRHFHAPAKVLVLDCDNTIWGGVIGEDGLEGIALGQDGLGATFVDFQKEVKQLVNEGLLLVLASKNNENEVWDVFDKHPAMVLKRDDVVAWKINWNEKSENIKKIAQELDLGLDSFVFWDDNPIERGKARNLIPSVTTVEVPTDTFKWATHLRGLDCFAKFSVTADDLKKTSQYHNRAKFVRDSASVSDELTYLKSIKLSPSAQNINQGNIARAVQLCAKTNQYNFRTVRHSISDLGRLSEGNGDFCFTVGLSDIYGDHGIIGLVCLKPIDQKSIFIDTFLMSCRVLGRHLEAWILLEILKRAKKYGFERVIGEFVPTNRNVVAEDFFTQHCFDSIDETSILASELFSKGFTQKGRLYTISSSENKIPYTEIYEK